MEQKKQFVIAVYVDNQAGVLTRVTGMFTRRGFNIDALTVGETESPAYSRITITLSGDQYAREQLINQLRKLYNVIPRYPEAESTCVSPSMKVIVTTGMSLITGYRVMSDSITMDCPLTYIASSSSEVVDHPRNSSPTETSTSSCTVTVSPFRCSDMLPPP